MPPDDQNRELNAAREKIQSLETEVNRLRQELAAARRKPRPDREDQRLQAALQALEEGEARFAAIFDHSPAAIYLKATDGRLLMVNRAVQAIFGREPHEIVGKTDRQLLPAAAAEVVETNDRQVLHSQKAIEFQETIETPQGPSTFLSVKFPLRDMDGTIVALGGISTNITEIHRADREREQLLAELSATLDSLETAVIVYDTEGKITRMNRAAERGLGYDRTTLEKPFSERYSLWRLSSAEGRPQPVESSFFPRIMAGEVVRGEICVLNRGKDRKTLISINGSPIHTPDGKLQGAVVTLTDVSTVQTLQEKRDEILRALSEDLVTPVTAILGFATLLKEFPETDQALCRQHRDYLETIVTHAQDLKDRISRLSEAVRHDETQVSDRKVSGS
jgi:PAS domain S-box-containing protein